MKDIQKYQRISVIGISGSGKSVFARKLGEKTGLPVYHMDSLFWSENWRERPEKDWQKDEEEILDKPQWILEGYIDGDWPKRLKRSEATIWLDPPGFVCAWNSLKRSVKYARKPRPELPAGCTDDFDPSYFWTILRRKERADILKALGSAKPDNLVIFKSHKEARNFLKTL